jgi:hypothetical protein
MGSLELDGIVCLTVKLTYINVLYVMGSLELDIVVYLMKN